MKKIDMNSKGFTLIELLAVITIMGILMMVAIPAISRTIENSRRDTFANVAQTYINTVRNAVLADELTCGGVNVAATGEGSYYFAINNHDSHTYYQQTTDLMESGGYSSWGNAKVEGYVKWVKAETTRGTGTETTTETKTTYTVILVDDGKHGINTPATDQKIKRASVKTTGATVDMATVKGTGGDLEGATECTLA